MLSSHMRTLTKTRISIAAAFMLAMTASMMFAPTHAENSLRVTQSNEEGLEVKCEGNLNCEIIGDDDDTIVATSEGNTTSTSAVTTSLYQSNTIQSGSDLDGIDDEQDLGATIEGMVNRLIDEISGKLTNSLSLFRVAY